MTANYLRSLTRLALRVHPKPTWTDLGNRTLFLFRHLRNHSSSQCWIEYLANNRMASIAQDNPSLYRKPIRPYVSINWPNRAKVTAMIYHYDFLARQLAPAVFRQVVSPTGSVLLSFPTRNGDQLTVRLRYDGKFRKEGEATLDLESANHACRVSSLTFVVAASECGAPCFVIGAVSGLPSGVDKDIIRDTTKALFGLRPKALLLQVLQELAQAWGVPALLGVGNRIHTSRHPAYAFNRSRRFAIAYDCFWREVGGALRSDGLFSLPLASPIRDFQEIDSRKRSLYRQRYALIGDLRDRLHSGLRTWRTEPMLSATNGGKYFPPQAEKCSRSRNSPPALCFATPSP
jgi:uncharacterized protein VirK/YbjX